MKVRSQTAVACEKTQVFLCVSSHYTILQFGQRGELEDTSSLTRDGIKLYIIQHSNARQAEWDLWF